MEDIQRLQKIDRVRTQAVLCAEKRCRKLHMGDRPYTPQLHKSGLAINVWHLIIKKKYGKPISSTYIKRLSRQCGIPSARNLSLQDCIKLRGHAFSTYYAYAKDAEKHRVNFQLNIIDECDSIGLKKKANDIRQQQLQEESRRMHSRIQGVVGAQIGAPYHIELEDNNGTYLSTDRNKIERALMKEYDSKYRLAYSSPFLQEPLISDLGQLAINDKAQQILAGTYECDPSIPKHTQTFIRHLKMDPALRSRPLNPLQITREQSDAFWKNLKEKTSSSPSQMHIGTYKAALANKINAEIQAQLISIPYEIGYPLPRTTNCINVSLEKKGKGKAPGDLRTIWLMEADLNAGSRIHFVSRMMNHTALQNNQIPNSQYSKKGSRAPEATIVKILYFDILRQTRQHGVFFASDLDQCFDRMAHPVYSLASQRLGVHPNVISCMFTAIHQMKHRVRTGYGDADVYYGDDYDNPLQGGGQGNEASLPLFVAISCILINVLESAVKGVSMYTAMSLQLLQFIAIMYVDDTDILLAALSDADTIESIIKRAKKAASVWQKAVLDSGGAVRPDKCYWSAVDFAWTSGRWRYKKMKEIEGQIRIRDTDGKLHIIERYDIHQAKEGLGVFVTPSGDLEMQLKKITEKIGKWTVKVKTSSLVPKETYTAAVSTIFRTITYILPSCSFNKKQCKLIEVSLYRVLLPKLGISEKLPLPYRFAPHKFQGLALLQVHVHIIIEKLKFFLLHAGTHTQLGLTYTGSLEAIQIEVGSTQQFFRLNFLHYGHLTPPSWLRSLWESLYEYNIILAPGLWTIQPPRTNDFA